MKVRSFDDLYIDLFRDLYSAETQLAEALPEIIDCSSNPDLKKAFEKSLKTTLKDKERLEMIAKEIDVDPLGQTCPVMGGLLSEIKEYFKDIEDDNVMDAALIVGLQKARHYEIASYGTVATFAHILDYGNIGNVFHEIKDEKQEDDAELTNLAKGMINQKALLHY
ncbi:hypothetical protein Psta_0826 [Sporocytophaga myxococcoides]|uniref:Uncharacterized protein n=1 Tax=Sporocytophaga myxococcoides TaxID=153721 RepID=A0A098L884_9BACT|nr:DUF892 family protein [Sporocytophaga myxococcoides]GAL82840.1 hypothetical protein Psta_0826 [Sporocytophaga myxococcoides]